MAVLIATTCLLAPGCASNSRSLTAPEVIIVIQCQPLPRSHFWEVKKIINDTVENHTTTVFEHKKTRWRGKQQNSGTCYVHCRSDTLNRAEVFVQAESLQDVLVRRFKQSGYDKAINIALR